MLTYICESKIKGKALYRCRCGAGLEAFKGNVNRGHTKSCGCLRLQVTAARSTTHGHKRAGQRSRAYVAWSNMRARCSHKGSKDFANYGGRGITVCREWERFEAFLADMGEPPDETSLDRIDNAAGYSPANCRWAPRKVQAQNKRSVVLYEHDGRRMCIADWARETGIGRCTLLLRLQRGVPFADAIGQKGYLRWKKPRSAPF